ncbi:MAG: carbohydrate-binding domain-containing protein [Bacteroidales bacterium]|nr:carbohydrate-binding domain-containing protein [Bacteroidales bacterium]
MINNLKATRISGKRSFSSHWQWRPTVSLCSMMLAMAVSIPLASCTEDDPWSEYEDSNSGSSSSGSSSGTVDVTTSTASDVLGFTVSFDTSDRSTYATSGETAPTDENASDYEDYIENYTSTQTITITYNGSTASADKEVDGVTVEIDGADVNVTSTTAGVTYVLTGSSTDGSFRMGKSDDNKKFGLTLNGLTLSKTGAPAINIQPSKRCYLNITGINTLSDSGSYDSSDEDRKGCFFTEGKLLISGTGSLSVNSEEMHAMASDEYVWIHDGTDLTLVSGAKDGLHTNDSIVVTGGYASITGADDGMSCDADVVIRGGLLHISSTGDAGKGITADGSVTISGGKTVVMTSGDAVYDSSDADYSSCAGIKADGDINIQGGVVQAQSTGTGGKGFNADGTINISGGTVQIATTGKRAGSGNTTSSPKGIKCDGNLNISGGNTAVKLSGTGDGTEGIESKSEIYITGGCTASYSYDDAINSAGNLYIRGGYMYMQSLNNDAVDANKNIYIQGGSVVAVGAGQPENALDAAEGYNIYVSGGNVFGIGGSTSETASSSSQGSIAFTSSVSGKTLGLFDASGNGLFAVTVPSTSCTACYMTADGMSSGSSYTVKTGVTVSGGTTWCGINIDGSFSGGSELTTQTAAANVGTGMGMGGQTGGGTGGSGRMW